jgi:peptidoglycan/LPS O-acetylase OafA/YrhL
VLTDSASPPAVKAGRIWPIAVAFTILAIVMTWPLTRDIATWIAWDMGDPVFNSWVLMWTGGQVLATLGGDFNAIHQYWHGNIFSPEQLTITYSEHLTP